VNAIPGIFGTELPGAKGETLADQDRIDITVAGGCAVGGYSAALCDTHMIASAERRRELAEQSCLPVDLAIEARIAAGLAMIDQTSHAPGQLSEMWVEGSAWEATVRDGNTLCVVAGGDGNPPPLTALRFEIAARG